MRRLIWTTEASTDLRAIQGYVSQFNPFAAHRLARRLIAAAESLRQLPHRGRPVWGGVRELAVVWPYTIRYIVEDDGTIYVVTIRHGAREPL